MPDLHTRLVAAVNARLEVARAATPGPWKVHESAHKYGDTRGWFIAELSRFHGHLLNHVYFDDDEQTARFIAVNDPATVIRHCERDLRVLERHAPFDQSNWSAARGSFTEPACEHCQLTSNDGDPLARRWPCDDIEDLATAYGVEADHA